MATTKSEIIGEVTVRRDMLALGPIFREELIKAMRANAIELQGYVKSKKLSGQVLKNRTGTLRRSINQKVEATSEGVFASVGTNVRYGAVHEFGFKGKVSVKQHLRTIKGGTAHTVSAHTRTVALPERSFLRTAIREMREKLMKRILDVTNKLGRK